MQEAGQVDGAYSKQRRKFPEIRPLVAEDGDSVTLQFHDGEVQSQMLASDPDFLVLSYTRTMMAFMLFYPEPERMAIIGLGGGSMPKWCYRYLPATDITVIEISAMVISLREEFCIPADDDRFRVICGDGADYVASTSDSQDVLLPEVLLVDGFDIHGQPPQLCSQEFYDNCYRALAPDGLLVANLCTPGDQQSVDRIRRSFDNRVLIVTPEDGENQIVFAVKGTRLQIEDGPADEFIKKLRDGYLRIPFLVQS
jgi:spermidine synthase